MTRPSLNKLLAVALTAVLISGLTISGCGKQPQGKPRPPYGNPISQENPSPGAPVVGQPLPAFALEDQNGQSVSVPSGFPGRAIYLTFFSTG